MKQTLNLIVFTGWPADGKTTLSKRLSLEEGFLRISTDELRRELHPKDYDHISYPEVWLFIWEKVCGRRDNALLNSKNVIIDSCAHTQYIRDRFFDLDSIRKDLTMKNIFVMPYLVQLTITNEERMRRFQKDDTVDGGMFSMRRMSSEFQFLEDYKRKGVTVLQFPNNNEDEQEKCSDLLRLL